MNMFEFLKKYENEIIAPTDFVTIEKCRIIYDYLCNNVDIKDLKAFVVKPRGRNRARLDKVPLELERILDDLVETYVMDVIRNFGSNIDISKDDYQIKSVNTLKEFNLLGIELCNCLGDIDRFGKFQGSRQLLSIKRDGNYYAVTDIKFGKKVSILAPILGKKNRHCDDAEEIKKIIINHINDIYPDMYVICRNENHSLAHFNREPHRPGRAIRRN